MDIYDWKQINKHIDYSLTQKKFYGKYYSKVKYYCPGFRGIRLFYDKDSASLCDLSLLKARLAPRRSYGYNNYGYNFFDYKKVDVWQLYIFLNVMKKFSNIKSRIEEPSVTFYAEQQEDLYMLAQTDLHEFRDRLMSVYSVDHNRKQLLDSDANILILTKPTEFSYKIIFRSGEFYNKLAVYEYLKNLGDTVAISETVRKRLTSRSQYLYQSWIYTKDISIVTFLELIEPKIVSNILTIKYAE